MANPLLTDEQNRKLANQNSTYNQIMQGFEPVQQQQDDSWLGGLSRGAKAGLGSVGAGLLHAGQAAFGTDGSLAAGFDAMAKNNAQRREWDLADTLSLDYLTNPEGLAYGLGQLAGSMALPALFGAGVAAAVPTGGTSLLGTGALIGAAGAAPMAISEGGNTYAQGLQQGMTEDEAKKAGLTDAAIKLPFYMLSEGLSGKVAQGLISKGLLNAEGKSLGRRAAESGAKILGNAANEAYEEGTENRSSAYALGDQRISSLGNIFNPFDWNEEDKAQAVGVFTPTLALGALTGGAGHLRSRFDKKSSDVAEEIASEDGGTIEEAPEANVSGREAFINAIAGQESGGNYNAENGDTGAYGKYQILPSNWPEWAEEAGIGADAPRTPENQEIVARFKLGQYYDKYGARGAAIAWYGGEGALNYSDEALNRKQGDNGEYPSINEYADEVLGRMGNVADSVRIDDTEENYFDESNYTDNTIPDSLNPVRGFDVSHLDKGTAQDRNSLLYGERVKKAKPAPASEEVASFNQSLDNSNAQKAPNSLFVNSPRSWDAAERIYKARAKEQAERKARAQAIANIANAQQQSFLNVLKNRAAQQWDNVEQEYKDRKQDKLQSLANVINARAAQKWDAKEADNAQKAKAEQEKQAQLQNIARLLDARAAGQYDVAQQVYANRAKEQAERKARAQALVPVNNAVAPQMSRMGHGELTLQNGRAQGLTDEEQAIINRYQGNPDAFNRKFKESVESVQAAVQRGDITQDVGRAYLKNLANMYDTVIGPIQNNGIIMQGQDAAIRKLVNKMRAKRKQGEVGTEPSLLQENGRVKKNAPTDMLVKTAKGWDKAEAEYKARAEEKAEKHTRQQTIADIVNARAAQKWDEAETEYVSSKKGIDITLPKGVTVDAKFVKNKKTGKKEVELRFSGEKISDKFKKKLRAHGFNWNVGRKAWVAEENVITKAVATRLTQKENEKGNTSKQVENTAEPAQDKVDNIQAKRTQAKQAIEDAPKGKTVEATTDNGVKFGVQYAIVPADSLITSNNASDFSNNEAYPQELQPRDRNRAYMRLQVEKMSGTIEPERITTGTSVNEGAPIVNKEGIVENGNGRTMALARMWRSGNKKLQKTYRDYLAKNAVKFGLLSSSLKGIDNPILVRIRTDNNVSVSEVTASTKGGAQLSTAEQALQDSKKLKDSTLAKYEQNRLGTIDNAKNAEFVRAVFKDIIPEDELNAYTTTDGSLSKSGRQRAVNAILAKAYGADPVLFNLVESTDEAYGKIGDALIAAAPTIAKLKALASNQTLFDVDLAGEILKAIKFVSNAKANNMAVFDAVSQQSMFADYNVDELTKKLALFIDNNKGAKWKNIVDMVTVSADVIAKKGSPLQGNVFGEEVKAPTAEEVLTTAINRVTNGEATAIIRMNDEKGQIEIKFVGNVSESVKKKLAKAKFKLSLEEQMWHADRNAASMKVAKELGYEEQGGNNGSISIFDEEAQAERNAGETASTESIKTEAKQPAESNQDEVNKKAVSKNASGIDKAKVQEVLEAISDTEVFDGLAEPTNINKMIVGKSKEELYKIAIDNIKSKLGKIFTDPLSNKIYFAPGNTESIEDYALHLIAGMGKLVEDIRVQRVLGVLLSDKTIQKPWAIIRQANGRKMYLSVYRGANSMTNGLIIGVEEGQDGRVVTSMLTANKKGDKKAALREFKKHVSGADEVLYIWEGLTGHSRPSSDQQASTANASLDPSGNQSIAQPAENVKKLNLPKGTTVDVSIVGNNSNIIQVKFNGAQGEGTGGIMGRAGYKWKSDKQVWQARKTEKAMDVAELLGYKPTEKMSEDKSQQTDKYKNYSKEDIKINKERLATMPAVDGILQPAAKKFAEFFKAHFPKSDYTYETVDFWNNYILEFEQLNKILKKYRQATQQGDLSAADAYFQQISSSLDRLNNLLGKLVGKDKEEQQAQMRQEFRDSIIPFFDEYNKIVDKHNAKEDAKKASKAKKQQGKQEYKYYLNARPADIGAVPKGFIRVDTEDKGGRYGAIYYDRQLNDTDVQQYELKSADDVETEKAQKEALETVSKELLKSDKLKAQAKNNSIGDFVLAYRDAVDDYLAEHVDENPAYTKLLNNPEIADEFLESESIIEKAYDKLKDSDNSQDVVQSNKGNTNEGGNNNGIDITGKLSSNDTGSRRAENEIRTTSSSEESSGSNGQGSRTLEGQSGRNGNNGVPGSRTAVGGKTSISKGSEQVSAVRENPARSAELSGSVVDSLQEQPNVDEGSTDKIVESVADGRTDAADTVNQKVNEVVKENNLDRQRADRLRKTAKVMPFLSKIQFSNTDFVADRLADNGKQGVMITDGTGTGKTFSGLAVAKEMVEDGKENILIVTPSDSVNNQWANAAKDFFGIELSKLDNIQDAGKGAVITTYANLGANDALIKRDWDLVICDESHYLMNNEQGEKTAALAKLRQLTLHPRELRARAEERILPEEKLEARRTIAQAAKLKRKKGQLKASEEAIVEKAEKLQKEKADELSKEERVQVEAQVKDWEQLNTTEKPKVMFMSATPFAYVPDIDYAEGYLFDYPKVEGGSYNQPGNGFQQFMIEHFGYHMRYNKLTKPDKAVDNAVMEVEFHEWLRKTGALTGHELEIDKDYNRGFLLVDQGVGKKIDEGFEFLRNNHDKYRELEGVLNKQFDSRRRNYLLESIKARESVPIIQQYLKAGKKVVVFYETNVERESFNPFKFTQQTKELLQSGENRWTSEEIQHEMDMFAKERPDLVNLNLDELSEPISIYREAFGDDAMFFNGRVSKNKRAEYVKAFNDDNSDKNLIFVQQDAGNAGISLHDTTGKHQRVLINIGIPRRPSYAIQIEGRIYRLGNKSNAIIRYLTTATNIENGLFAETVAGRASTAENLALGRRARGLRDSFKNAYQEIFDGTWEDRSPGTEGEDVGGKENDRNIVSTDSDYDRAKAFYFARGKKTAKNKAAEGVDYFATPEPVGYKMVQWAGLKDGDRVLEPSAGHGAISRFFSPNTDNTIIEPSSRLAPQAQMNTDNAKLINGYFEDLHIGNKYDAVTMNPPFGTGGKTAVEHVAKAFKHLRNGGRVIAIIPRGAMADKRFNTWYESDDAKDAHMVGEVLLPGVTFERAGTKVATRIVIIDKGGESQGVKRIDLSRINNINELFDNLESVEMPARQTKQADAGTANFANSLRKGDAEGNSEVVTADSYKHTKTGEIIPSAKLNANLSDEEYRKVKSIADKNGGYYSRYAKAFLFQDNETGRDKFVEEVNGANNTQYSVSSEAVQRAKEEVEAEIRAAFPNGKVEYVNGVPTITMPNGSKFQYSIRENIVVNAKEQRKADAAHGTSGARVQGFWKKFTGNGVQRMLAVSKNSERGTAFHEAMHAAIDLVLTEKEKNALYNYYEKKAKEQNRDVDEVIADAYRDWVLARQRKSGTMFGKLWRKVKDFCTRIKAIFDKGAEVERIMQDIESGRVYERGTNNHSVTKRISFSKEEIQGQKGSGTTQVATTRTMYVKALKWLRNQSPEAKTVLDYGAGLGLGTDDMRSNNPDLNIDCYEPNPERWAGKQPPTYTNNTQINKDYDLILNTNVLNVVEKPIRDLIVKDIADHLTMGGKALITTRGWSNDVNAAKNFKPADEHHAIWINKGKNGYVFQKGFDGDELKNYIQELLGDEFVVEKTRPTFGKSSVTITRVKSSSEETHYSVASPKHKIANAFTNTERKGVVDSAKDFFKEHRKSLYQDWFDKNNPLKGFDALTKATGGLSVYDQVQSLPATTAGMLKALTEGTAQHVKMANQHLKNVKMKYNVTLAMALEKIDKKQMDKAYPKYLAENGFDNWVNALGAYLGAERCLEMARLARAEGKTYKFPKGLTEQECQDFVNKAPQQFKAAADIFYKVNDNVISIMEDAEVFSHDLAKTLRTKYRKYCPLLRDFSDTAAADSFIGGLTEGGRGIGNVSVPLKRINIEGSERGVLNPLETILKSYAVMLNRAERNKVALMAVENSRTADLHELIQEVPGTTADPKNCVFTVLINGKKKAYKTTQDLYGPIVGYNLPAANLAFGVARTAARMLRTGATMSPSFILRNVLRDTVFAGIASKNGFIPIVDTVRGAIALAKDPAMRAEFEAAGVTEYNFYSSQKSRIKSLDAMAGETPASAWEIMKAVFSRLEATSDFFESSTRMGEYMKARQKGLSMEEAARAAREVTLDFSRSGRVGEQVNQVVPFFNACLQGGDKMVRLFREDFVGTSLKVFKYIVLPSLLIMAMNWDEDWYKDLDPDIKNNYWCLGRNIRIPKPQEAGVLFGSGIEALFQQAADKDKDAVSNFLKAFSSNMIPSVLPTLILPLIEWSANYSFFKGRPLVGNKYSRLPDELQYNDYTSELSKGIGSALKVSPMKIDNLVRGYTGTMGALLWSMAGEPFAKANNLPAKHFSELPFVRDFNVTDANLSRPMNEFYGILDKANRQHAGYGVKGKPEAAVKGIRSAGSMISKIRKDIDKITHSNLTPERKRELIDKRKEKMNQIAKQATARYGKYFE